jgi:UrcA family protein
MLTSPERAPGFNRNMFRLKRFPPGSTSPVADAGSGSAMQSNGKSRNQSTGEHLMTASILPNIRRSSLVATFVIGTVALIGAGAQADDPDQVDQITVSAPTVKTVGHDSATGGPIEDTVKTARIQYDPVTLTTNSGVALLKDAVSEAARKICDSIDPLDPDDGTCLREAVDSAKPQVDAAIARARSTANG